VIPCQGPLTGGEITTAMAISKDCRLFTGYKPCAYQSQCDGCTHFEPMGTRILVVKLGAIGDALRTTPVVEGLRKKHSPCCITWVTDAASYSLLEGIPAIDRLRTLDLETFITLTGEHFNLLINFDKDPQALGFASHVKADEKMGFALSAEGKVDIYNHESLYAYELGLFDRLKFKENRLSYQEIVFPMAGLVFEEEEYALHLTPGEVEKGKRFFREAGLDTGKELLVGLNTGCGDIFATKKWTVEGFVALAGMLKDAYGAAIVLLGGPSERERNRSIEKSLPFKVYNTGNDNTLKVFASLVRCCHVVVTADTTALHIALALKVPVVSIFGSTSHEEIFLYGRGEKVISPFACSPCYRGHCTESPTCMEALKAEEVFHSTVKLIERHVPEDLW